MVNRYYVSDISYSLYYDSLSKGEIELDSKELKSVCAAARLGSVSRAASYLQLSQPTVTSHIQKLEKELGVMLFDLSLIHI